MQEHILSPAVETFVKDKKEIRNGCSEEQKADDGNRHWYRNAADVEIIARTEQTGA